jgi:hypothetical protein
VAVNLTGSPAAITVSSPAAALTVEARYADMDGELLVTVNASGVLQAIDPASAASEGEVRPVEVQVWDPLGENMLAVLGNREDARWLDDMNDAGNGSFLLHALDPLATEENLATRNLIRWVYSGRIRFTSRIEKRRQVVSGRDDFEDQKWRLEGRGSLALLSDAVVYPEYGLNKWTRKGRNFFFGSAEGPWYIRSNWFRPAGVKYKDVPDSHPWDGFPENWPDKNAQWIWPTNPNRLAEPGPAWFRSTFTLDKERTITVFVSADDSAEVYIDGERLMSTGGRTGNEFGFKRISRREIRLPKGDHLLAVRVDNEAVELEEVQPVVETNLFSPTLSKTGNDIYKPGGSGYQGNDGNLDYCRADGSVGSGGPGGHAFDGNTGTYWMSVGNLLGWSSNYEYVEGTFTKQKVTSVRVNVKGGPYDAYISLKNGSRGWNGSKTIPYRPNSPGGDSGARIRYVRKVRIPAGGSVNINVPDQQADRVRVTLHATWNSGEGYYKWRAAIREVKVTGETRTGSYIRGGNFAGLLLTIATLNNKGEISEVIHRSKPAGWLTTQNPEPGWKPAQILHALVQEAKARGVLGTDALRFGFTPFTDSYGRPWGSKVEDKSFNLGDDVLSVARKLAEESEIDVWMDQERLVLHAAPFRGDDKSQGADVVAFRPGHSARAFDVETEQSRGTYLLVETEHGWFEAGSVGANFRIGRVESIVSLGNALSIADAEKTAASLLDMHAEDSYDVSLTTTDLTGPRPYVDYDIGDVVLCPGGFYAQDLVRFRVLAVSISEGEAGELKAVIEADLTPED